MTLTNDMRKGHDKAWAIAMEIIDELALQNKQLKDDLNKANLKNAELVATKDFLMGQLKASDKECGRLNVKASRADELEAELIRLWNEKGQTAATFLGLITSSGRIETLRAIRLATGLDPRDAKAVVDAIWDRAHKDMKMWPPNPATDPQRSVGPCEWDDLDDDLDDLLF
jgi:hypothetical protein